MPGLVLTFATLSSLLYTPPNTKAPAYKGIPCQRHSILGVRHDLCWTFDDHPKRATLRTLKLLRRRHITATFFITASSLHQYTYYPKGYAVRQLQWFKRIHADGHLLGNHGITHKNLCKETLKDADKELRLSQKYMMKYAGVRVRHWRPPHAVLCKSVQRLTRKYGLTTIMYDVSDWGFTAKKMWKKLRYRVRRGKRRSVLLFHYHTKKLIRFFKYLDQNR